MGGWVDGWVDGWGDGGKMAGCIVDTGILTQLELQMVLKFCVHPLYSENNVNVSSLK